MKIELFDITVVLAIGAAIVAWTCWSGLFRKRHRKERLREGLNTAQKEIIGGIAVCRRLPPELKEKLYSKTAVFLNEKDFDGCDGMEITEEIRVTIAALACVLILNREDDFYPKLKTVVVHPESFYSDHQFMIGGQVIEEEDVEKLGESWDSGSLVISWDTVRADARRLHGHRNVALHEFAHQLDQLNGVANGMPALDTQEDYVRWERVMRAEFDRLRHLVKNRMYHTIDEYGATSIVEFFAVVTEAFFCNPVVTREDHPEMYRELVGYYRMDPAEWETLEEE